MSGGDGGDLEGTVDPQCVKTVRLPDRDGKRRDISSGFNTNTTKIQGNCCQIQNNLDNQSGVRYRYHFCR